MALVGETKLPYGQVPLLLLDGNVTLLTNTGRLVNITLDTHSFLLTKEPAKAEVRHVIITRKMYTQMLPQASCDLMMISSAFQMISDVR